MKAEWNTRLAEVGLDDEIIQVLETHDVGDWMQLTQKNLREFQEMGFAPQQISKIFLAVKENMQ